MNRKSLLIYRVINNAQREAWEPLARQYSLLPASDLRHAITLLRQVPIACIITEVPRTRAVAVDELRYFRNNFQTIPLAVCDVCDPADLGDDEIEWHSVSFRMIPAAGGNPLVREIASLVEKHTYPLDLGIFGIGAKPYPARIKRALELIQRDFLRKDLAVSQIAMHLNVHRCHFDREFQYHCGISPKQLIIGLKLLLAVFLMKNEGLKLLHVARLSGFPDYYEFCKLFCRHMGMPPSRFRRDHGFQDFARHFHVSSARRRMNA